MRWTLNRSRRHGARIARAQAVGARTGVHRHGCRRGRQPGHAAGATGRRRQPRLGRRRAVVADDHLPGQRGRHPDDRAPGRRPIPQTGAAGRPGHRGGRRPTGRPAAGFRDAAGRPGGAGRGARPHATHPDGGPRRAATRARPPGVGDPVDHDRRGHRPGIPAGRADRRDLRPARGVLVRGCHRGRGVAGRDGGRTFLTPPAGRPARSCGSEHARDRPGRVAAGDQRGRAVGLGLGAPARNRRGGDRHAGRLGGAGAAQ